MSCKILLATTWPSAAGATRPLMGSSRSCWKLPLSPAFQTRLAWLPATEIASRRTWSAQLRITLTQTHAKGTVEVYFFSFFYLVFNGPSSASFSLILGLFKQLYTRAPSHLSVCWDTFFKFKTLCLIVVSMLINGELVTLIKTFSIEV